MKDYHLQHLYLRAGFGPTVSDLQKNLSVIHTVHNIFNSSKNYTPLKTLNDPIGNLKASKFKLALLLLRSKEQTKKLNLDWLDRMVNSEAQLREKMTFFWHGHFATRSPFAYLAQVQNNILRKYALSNFRELLYQISKDPAMLIFLNNQQNKKDAPNENYARELLELFTLGEGILYNEKDIKEAARAFTGWQTNRFGKFEFNKNQHDFGKKEFMGRTGNFNGYDIIDIILEHKEAAHFLATKLYRFFVNDSIDQNQVNHLADIIYGNNYEIEPTLLYLFTAEWFYAEENIGAKTASPVELIARLQRLIPIKMKNAEVWLHTQHALGQMLFNPPNVAGWPGGRSWIDQSSLVFRMSIPALLFEHKLDEWANKANWAAIDNFYRSMTTRDIVNNILPHFPQSVVEIIEQHAANEKQNDRHKMALLRVMMTPEFQLI